jgi:hypothetical protein
VAGVAGVSGAEVGAEAAAAEAGDASGAGAGAGGVQKPSCGGEYLCPPQGIHYGKYMMERFNKSFAVPTTGAVSGVSQGK